MAPGRRTRRDGVEEGKTDGLHQRAEAAIRAQAVEGTSDEVEEQTLACEHRVMEQLECPVAVAEAEMDEGRVVVPDELGGGAALELRQHASGIGGTTRDAVEVAEHSDRGGSGAQQMTLHFGRDLLEAPLVAVRRDQSEQGNGKVGIELDDSLPALDRRLQVARPVVPPSDVGLHHRR